MVIDPIQAARNWRDTAEKRGAVITQLLEEESRISASGQTSTPPTMLTTGAETHTVTPVSPDYRQFITEAEQTTPNITATTGDPPQPSQPASQQRGENSTRMEPVIRPDSRGQGFLKRNLKWIILGLVVGIVILVIVAIFIYALPNLGNVGTSSESAPNVNGFWSGTEYPIDQMQRKWVPLWITAEGQRYTLWTNNTYTSYVSARLAYYAELQKINDSIVYVPALFKNGDSGGTDELVRLLKQGNVTFYQSETTDSIIVEFVKADLIRFVKVGRFDKKIDLSKAGAISSFSPYYWKSEETAALSASMKHASNH